MDIEYFPDADVVLIHGHEPKTVAHFREQVAALAAERLKSFSVHELPGFRSVDGCRLFASRADSDFGTRRTREPQTFECQLRPVTWQNIEGLLEPFADVSEYHYPNGHQYLDEHGKIQLIISFGRDW
jgi:hypothetical protein